MADYAKDSEKQAALRRQIENHPIWQYPPEERLQHNREWQSLYLLVFEFKEFLQKLENRLNNAGYDTGYLKQDEDAMLEARYTRRGKLRNKLDTLAFTESMRKAVARYDASSGKEFMAYFDTIYANAMHESVNKQSMREQGNVRLTRGEARLWKRLCELCEKQGIDPSELPAAFYARAAEILDVDVDALKSLVRNATAARRTVSLNCSGDNEDDGSGFDHRFGCRRAIGEADRHRVGRRADCGDHVRFSVECDLVRLGRMPGAWPRGVRARGLLQLEPTV